MSELSTPRFRNRPRNQSPKLRILDQSSLDSTFAEAYRTLRSNIVLGNGDRSLKSIAVTSASHAEGRTTTVLNLGIVTARAGPRVVIVEADFRRPTMKDVMTELARVSPELLHPGGLSSVVAGSVALQDALWPTRFDRLSVIPAGRSKCHPTELLSSKRMRCVLAELSEAADQVIFDTPPCLAYADALLLANLVDGVVHVVRAGSRNKEAQPQAQKHLRHAGARMLGVVVNDIAAADITKYGYRRGDRHGREAARS
ncbi:MAG: CpsD/CapB family tyrosine-protein kinase [Candidatus Dormibacteraeota bacterium]|nr:CpsD/CapB family tyrosine-protein kinase [Candidatus Dormibacteraeota bacterium]